MEITGFMGSMLNMMLNLRHTHTHTHTQTTAMGQITNTHHTRTKIQTKERSQTLFPHTHTDTHTHTHTHILEEVCRPQAGCVCALPAHINYEVLVRRIYEFKRIINFTQPRGKTK